LREGLKKTIDWYCANRATTRGALTHETVREL